MIETRATYETVASPLRLCPEGYKLWREWVRTVTAHDKEKLYSSMKAYFSHKVNCPPCWGVHPRREV